MGPVGFATLIPDPDDVTEDRMLRATISDLPQVMRVRLLGRDPDLFAAVDRHRAEVEFRLAVIPPVIVLAAVAVARLSPWYSLLAGVLGLLSAVGLLWDARNRQREANDMLAEALADGRVRAPSLERLETAAVTLANRPEVEAMRNAAAEFAKPLAQALEFTRGSLSDFSHADRALTEVGLAEARLEPVRSRFSAAAVAAAERYLETLRDAVTRWTQALHGGTAENWIAEVQRLVEEADQRSREFRSAVLDELASYTEGGSRVGRGAGDEAAAVATNASS